MKRLFFFALLALLALTTFPQGVIDAVPFTSVHFNDVFWRQRLSSLPSPLPGIYIIDGRKQVVN
ncbi:MAG: hypothetical protein J6I36_07775 [Bacteroidaceae bacterium]|nr:hypothetical protein [Bacteroidaceae bacterium]